MNDTRSYRAAIPRREQSTEQDFNRAHFIDLRTALAGEENYEEFTEAARELFDALAANATEMHRASAGDSRSSTGPSRRHAFNEPSTPP